MNRGFNQDPRRANNPNKHGSAKLDSKQTKGVLLRLGAYILKYWPLFILAIAMTLVSNHLSLLGPMYSGRAIDAIAAEEGVQFPIIWQNLIKMLICYAASAVTSYLLAVLMLNISQKITYTMRRKLFEKLTTLKVGYFDTHATGDIISRISYDIDTINASLSHDLVQVMTSLYTVLGSLLFMWQISKPLIAVFAVTVPASVLFTRYRSKKIRPMFSLRSAKLGELNAYAEEMLSGCRTIHAYNREEEMDRRFAEHNREAMDAYYKAEYYASAQGPTVNFINNLSLSMVMMFGGILYMLSVSGAAKAGGLFFITIGGVAQFVQYSRKFAGPINEFANILHEFQSAFSAAERVFRILDEEPESADAADAYDLKKADGNVSLENVTFGYTPEKTILRNISVDVKPGCTVAIVGPTGAGKTTIINLLMRFYDVDSGQIKVNGRDIRTIMRDPLRRAYTMVLQDTWLFHGTVFDNIAYGRQGATPEEVKAAAKAARIDSFIESLPDGYDTLISDEGVNISKGQRQLITIARAFLSDSEMLILDEATSNVDSRTEIKIQDAMNDLMRERTCFVIAHRLSTIRDADMILVLDDGKIVGEGQHGWLMDNCEAYREIYDSQMREEVRE